MTARKKTPDEPKIGTLQVERVPYGTLKPHKENPRTGDVDAIIESITINGVFRPVICASDYTILAGHHLYQALGELGHDDVDVVRIPVAPDSAEARKVMLADNRTSDLAGYDDGLLLGLLKDLTADGNDLLGTGWSVEYDLPFLERKVEADLRFGVDQQGAIDEFDKIAGFDTSKPGKEYFDVIRVYFRDKDARDEFFTQLGREYQPGQATLRHPAEWTKREHAPLDVDTLGAE